MSQTKHYSNQTHHRPKPDEDRPKDYNHHQAPDSLSFSAATDMHRNRVSHRLPLGSWHRAETI